jgi:alcohol dehydrogenase
MKAAVFEQFRSPLEIRIVPDPVARPDAAIISMKACGVCRSDWHGWMGHDSDIRLPHVPGHELAGVVVSVGRDVHRYQVGERVTVPFCCGCGSCSQCESGNQQICDQYTQPGFTQWGAFAEFVEIRHADVNLVKFSDAALRRPSVPSSHRDVLRPGIGFPFTVVVELVYLLSWSLQPSVLR